jgi:hypothetical protein
MSSPGENHASWPAGVWMHAHEEDSGDRLVFKRAASPLPLSRGRSVLVLNEDGTVSGSSPGPDDRPVAVTGKWRLDADARVVLDLAGKATAPSILKIESPDRLVASRTPPP